MIFERKNVSKLSFKKHVVINAIPAFNNHALKLSLVLKLVRKMYGSVLFNGKKYTLARNA